MPSTPILRAARPAAALVALMSLAGLAPAGCLYEDGELCGPNQHHDSDRPQCVCNEGYGLVNGECVPCGEYEKGNPTDACTCMEGYARTSATSPCVPAAGAACTTDADCTIDAFSHCVTDGERKYCTSTGCVPGQGKCPGDFACNDRVDVPFCQAPPIGLGKSCKTPADCAGTQATYCESAMSGMCLVQGCVENPDACHGDWACCDIAILKTSLCVPLTEVTGTSCANNVGKVVPR